MKKYSFDLLETGIRGIKEKNHLIPAHSLEDAIGKFSRKYDLEAPAYWDEPSYDRFIELTFKSSKGTLKYQISW